MILAFVLALVLGAPPERPSWLEVNPLVNWNKPGAGLPGPPSAPSPDPRCLEQARPALSPQDRAVTAAGWTLVGAAQLFGRTRAFLATAGFDGMCRPLDFQGFVFVEGKLAGTLSPQPMRSRTDGALLNLRLTSEQALSADFARYLEQDPLCCASRRANVSYAVESGPEGPLVVPGAVRVEAGP